MLIFMRKEERLSIVVLDTCSKLMSIRSSQDDILLAKSQDLCFYSSIYQFRYLKF
jgi:hypothetical protein